MCGLAIAMCFRDVWSVLGEAWLLRALLETAGLKRTLL